MDLRPVVASAASLLIILAVCFALTAGVAALGDGRDTASFLVCAAAAAFLGLGLRLVASSPGGAAFGARELPIFATGSAALLILFAATPFALGSARMPFASAIFEAASGL